MLVVDKLHMTTEDWWNIYMISKTQLMASVVYRSLKFKMSDLILWNFYSETEEKGKYFWHQNASSTLLYRHCITKS